MVKRVHALGLRARFLDRSESHDVALQQVWQAIRRKEGFIVLAVLAFITLSNSACALARRFSVGKETLPIGA